MDKNLTELAQKHNCDKSSHGYMPHYQRHLPKTAERILEVGCEHGESLRMWRELYPNAEIHTIDLFQNPLFAQEREIAGQGFITHRGDQFYKKTYTNLTGKFDFIIEDGSHNAHHQLFSFNAMFEEFVKPEGLYVMEDLHTNWEDERFYWGPIDTFNDTPLGSMKRKGSWFWALYGQLIETLDIYDDKIAFIKKRNC